MIFFFVKIFGKKSPIEFRNFDDVKSQHVPLKNRRRIPLEFKIGCSLRDSNSSSLFSSSMVTKCKNQNQIVKINC